MSCSRGGCSSGEPAAKTVRVQDQKEKMQAELQALWKESCDQLRRKKEQFATEVSGAHKGSAREHFRSISPKKTAICWLRLVAQKAEHLRSEVAIGIHAAPCG